MHQTATNFFGIVVRRQRYKERDALVTILTKEYGFRTFWFVVHKILNQKYQAR